MPRKSRPHRRSRRALFGSSLACAIAALLALPDEAHAEGGPVTLTWTAPKECPTGAEVAARASQRLPQDTAHVAATGVVDKQANGGYRVALDIEVRPKASGAKEAHGERVIEAPTCEALASSAAVVLAMSAASLEKDDRETPAATTTTTATTTPRASESDAPPPPPPPVAASGARRFGLRAQVAGDVGSLPSAGIGGGLAFLVNPTSRLHLEVGGNLWASQDGVLAADPSRGAEFHLVTAGARGCVLVLGSSSASMTLAPCVGADVIVLSAKGFGAAKPADATQVAVAPLLGLFFEAALAGHVALRLGLEASAPTSRQAFVISQGSLGSSEIHRASPVALRGFFGPEITF